MTFAVAANVRKAVAADAFHKCTYPHGRWTAKIDDMIHELSSQHHLAEIARIIGMDQATIKSRADKLGVTFLTVKEAREPTPGEWIHYATLEALRARIPPRLVMGGYKSKRACRARWQAWAAILDDNPDYGLAGVARVCGHHHATVMHGLKRIGWTRKPAPHTAAE